MDDGRGWVQVSPEGERCEETSPGARHGRWARLGSNQRPLACEMCPGCCRFAPPTAVCASASTTYADRTAICCVLLLAVVSRPFSRPGPVHRLLPQPGGFEGIRWLREEACVDDLAAPHSREDPERDGEVDAARSPASPESANADDLFSGVSGLVDLESHLFPLLGHLGEKPLQPVMAPIGLALQLSAQGIELRLLVPQGHPGFAVAAIPCVDGRECDLDVLLRHRLLGEPDRFESLGAVKVVVGLDDEAVPEAVNDGEGLRVGRVVCASTHDPRAGDEPAVAHLDQVIEADLDRPEQIDQALHPFKRGATSPVDTGVGPAGSLTVDGILGPELLGHRCRTRLVPDLIGPADALRPPATSPTPAARRLRGP